MAPRMKPLQLSRGRAASCSASACQRGMPAKTRASFSAEKCSTAKEKGSSVAKSVADKASSVKNKLLGLFGREYRGTDENQRMFKILEDALSSGEYGSGDTVFGLVLNLNSDLDEPDSIVGGIFSNKLSPMFDLPADILSKASDKIDGSSLKMFELRDNLGDWVLGA